MENVLLAVKKQKWKTFRPGNYKVKGKYKRYRMELQYDENANYATAEEMIKDWVKYALPTQPLNLYRVYGLKKIPPLPPNLQILRCGTSTFYGGEDHEIYITELPPLPKTLRVLDCPGTHIKKLPSLPPSLKSLTLTFCKHLETLPPLPPSLQDLHVDMCESLKVLPSLPPSLKLLSCNFSPIASLPPLPQTLKKFYCYNSSLEEIPFFPLSLRQLSFYSDDLLCNTLRNPNETERDFILRSNRRKITLNMLKRSLPILFQRVAEFPVSKDSVLVTYMHKKICDFL